jgi:hypothetical protein
MRPVVAQVILLIRSIEIYHNRHGKSKKAPAIVDKYTALKDKHFKYTALKDKHFVVKKYYCITKIS